MNILAWKKSVWYQNSSAKSTSDENLCWHIVNDSSFLWNVISADEPFVFQYDPKTKLTIYGTEWVQHPFKRKHRWQIQIQRHDRFYIEGIIYANQVPQGQAVNQVYRKEILKTLHK
jgi:hypothetical protein